MHNPGNCLGAAGWKVGARTVLGVREYCGVTCEVTRWNVSQGGVKMQAYSTVFRRYSEAVAEQASPRFWNDTRLKSVFTGRRDAPVLILLVYLPIGRDDAEADTRFDEIMRAVFCKSAK
jgi:hypothetical protein